MTLKELQKDVEECTSQGPYWEPHEILARVVEETGELAREINHVYGPKRKKPGEPIGDIGEEMGDIIFALMCLANSNNIDMDDAWKKVMEKCNVPHKDRFEKKEGNSNED